MRTGYVTKMGKQTWWRCRTHANPLFSMTQAGRIEPTVQALLQNSAFVYK